MITLSQFKKNKNKLQDVFSSEQLKIIVKTTGIPSFVYENLVLS